MGCEKNSVSADRRVTFQLLRNETGFCRFRPGGSGCLDSGLKLRLSKLFRWIKYDLRQREEEQELYKHACSVRFNRERPPHAYCNKDI
jgi:hypothetical protein